MSRTFTGESMEEFFFFGKKNLVDIETNAQKKVGILKGRIVEVPIEVFMGISGTNSQRRKPGKIPEKNGMQSSKEL